MRELSEQTDLAHADGRARFAESARPLIAKVPEGVYRELLTARVAEVVGLTAERLQALWASAAPSSRTPDVSSIRASAPPRTAAPGALPPGRASGAPHSRLSAGRGSLVRQAIARVVRFPTIAVSISPGERSGLDDCDEPGIALLRELLDDLRARPVSVPAQVLERWADRTGGEHLGRLLEREEVLGGAEAAALELKAALAKLADQVIEKRLKALEDKSQTGSLSPDELKEFQQLMRRKAGRMT